ncbi:hypothetical protein [Flavobacterium collinsii]|nr:hypothetical protein [Flavobacterium collinsii]
MRELGKESQILFDEKYNEIVHWYKEYNQLYILSFCMFYFMTNPKDLDEEAETGTLEFFPYYMELLQAFALTIPYMHSAKPLNDQAEVFKNSIKEIGLLNNKKFFNFPEHIKTSEELIAYQVRMQMMIQTMVVRNWAYEHQMQQITRDLALGISIPFKQLYDFEPEVLLELLYAMTGEVEIRINKHLAKLRTFMLKSDAVSILQQYEDIFDHVDKTTAEHKEKFGKMFRDMESLRMMLMMHSDLQLNELFTFDAKQLSELSNNRLTPENISSVFDKWSMEFNELQGSETTYFLLDNPVNTKPFIKCEDNRYFSSLWTVMTHLSIPMLEALIVEDPKLNFKYNKYRAGYLEQQLEQLCREAFPQAAVYAGSMWPGENNKLYENDIIIVIESFAIVIEAKSGSVSPPAKRGASERLTKTLKELIDEPSEQALRFIKYLKINPGRLSFKTKKGKNNIIDTQNLKFFIPLGVTLSHLGGLSANLKMLIEAGILDKEITELAPSMSLTDLQIVFDLLPAAPQKIHYLQRRREIEAHIDYMGDEIDLLAWYIDSGFTLGTAEYEEKNFYEITLKSKELDPYIIGKSEGEIIERPSLKLTPWWTDILARLESSKKQMWLENSFLLLNIGYEEQQQFEIMIKELIDRIKKGQTTDPHNYIEFNNNTPQRRYVLIGYPYKNEQLDQRNGIIQDILSNEEKADVKGMLLIGINIDKDQYPYSVMASIMTPELFDSEFTGMVSKSKNNSPNDML